MTLERAQGELAGIARARHVHFDVWPEMVVLARDRKTVGFEVRLWAEHARGARAMPGCPKCLSLAAELRRIAEWAAPAGYEATRIQIEPLLPELYESSVARGTDEIAIAIRLIHRNGYDRPIDAHQQWCLEVISTRLTSLGIPER